MNGIWGKAQLDREGRFMPGRFIGYVSQLPQTIKSLILISHDLIVLPIALAVSVFMITGSFDLFLGLPSWVYAAFPVFSCLVFTKAGLYRAIVRYIGAKAFGAILYSVTISSFFLVFLVEVLAKEQAFPRSVYVIYWMLATVLIGGTRMLARELINRTLRHQHPEKSEKAAVAVYGAGATGVQLSRYLRSHKKYQQVVFFDDDLKLAGREIDGIKVLFPSNLKWLCEQNAISQVFLALPGASAKRRKQILEALSQCSVRVKSVPGFSDIVSGKSRLEELQDITVEDLLGRDPVTPKQPLLEGCITGNSVMVTGAGGSIGSELCRQIIKLQPQRLVLFERSEFALYSIESELLKEVHDQQLNVEIIGLLGSVDHRRRVKKIMQSYQIETVYHAAAYKHVPIVERNPIEGVRNNIFGTYFTALAARDAGVETFVLISTDKAVRPKNVMGASKRMAELILQGLAQSNSATKFCMVRFGNVLNSSGSVVPLFREQIEKGGPVTVTHPEITRYFMTIPEAAQLVLQAGSLAKGGDVFLLDMGDPVKIIDLARKMINLSGYSCKGESNPQGDIEIKIVGLRPGEKLYEELLIDDKALSTEHDLIMRAKERELPWPVLEKSLEKLDRACHEFDVEVVREMLLDLVQGYEPQCDIQDRLWLVDNPKTRFLDAEEQLQELPRIDESLHFLEAN